MNRLRRITPFCLVAAILGGSAIEVAASGTYPPAPPRLRADVTKEVDPEAYNLGKLIYAGRAKLAGGDLSSAEITENTKLLSAIVARIPERAREKLDVDQLARELNPTESSALLYYLKLRFRIEEVSA